MLSLSKHLYRATQLITIAVKMLRLRGRQMKYDVRANTLAYARILSKCFAHCDGPCNTIARPIAYCDIPCDTIAGPIVPCDISCNTIAKPIAWCDMPCNSIAWYITVCDGPCVGIARAIAQCGSICASSARQCAPCNAFVAHIAEACLMLPHRTEDIRRLFVVEQPGSGFNGQRGGGAEPLGHFSAGHHQKKGKGL